MDRTKPFAGIGQEAVFSTIFVTFKVISPGRVSSDLLSEVGVRTTL